MNPLVFEGGAFDPVSIIGSYLLLRGEGGEYDAEDRCFGQTSLLEPDTPCGPPDAGLFEIYENIVKPFIEAKIEAMESYVHLDGGVVAGFWQSRPFPHAGIAAFRQRVPLPDPFAPVTAQDRAMLALDDGRNGVSYCFGCTQFTERLRTDLTRNNAFWFGAANDLRPQHRGNVFEPTVSSSAPPDAFLVTVADINAIHGLRFPGRYQLLEYPARNNPAPMTQYRTVNWAGIDCSGLTWIAMVYSIHLPRGDIDPWLLETWTLPPSPEFRPEVDLNLDRATMRVSLIARRSFALGHADAAAPFYWTQVASNPVGFGWGHRSSRVHSPTMDPFARRGDLLIIPGHIGAVYSDGGVNGAGGAATAWSIEASGVEEYVATDAAGRAAPRFGRKAIIRDLRINAGGFGPRIAVREALWQ